MAPTTTATKKVQRTVFDLATFDDVTLQKEVTLPTKPTSVEEALAAVGNDASKLLDVIYTGLCDAAAETAKNDISGFRALDEDGKPGDADYTGTFADESKGKAINLAILNMAKAAGYDKSLPLETRNKLKADAKDLIKSNPAMLKFIAGV
jgi:hypothetical protein